MSCHGLIPTPSRSQRSTRLCAGADRGVWHGAARDVQHVAVQANRESIDGHARRPTPGWSTPAEQGVRPSISSRGGHDGHLVRAWPLFPRGDAARLAGSGDMLTPPGSARSSIGQLRYPRLRREVGSLAAGGAVAALSGRRPGSWGCRRALAQALSEAISEEFAELERTWSLGTPGGELRVEEVTAKHLRQIATKVERKCVLQVMMRPASTEWEAGHAEEEDLEELQRQCKQLEAEIAVVDERLDGLNAMEANRSLVFRAADPSQSVSKLVAQLSTPGVGAGPAAEAPAPTCGEFDQCLQRLALIDLWFRRTFEQLEEAERGLAEREYEVAQCAFSQLPGEAVDPQRALLRLR